jgi:hypothetical protein
LPYSLKHADRLDITALRQTKAWEIKQQPSSMEDITGRRFERLVVLGYLGRDLKGRPFWLCQCICGNETPVNISLLKNGGVRSCGCLNRDAVTKHGMKNSAEYSVWRAMRHRCENPANPAWANYGGRGISVCSRWERFESFFVDMGVRPSPDHSIDRYPDKNGNYEPSNCRWSTRIEQSHNKRNNRNLTALGLTLCIREWSRKLGCSHQVLSIWSRRGYPDEWVIARFAGSTPAIRGQK